MIKNMYLLCLIIFSFSVVLCANYKNLLKTSDNK